MSVAVSTGNEARWNVADDLEALAAAYAESAEFDKAVEWQDKANKLATDVDLRKKGEDRLKLYARKKPYRDEAGTTSIVAPSAR